MNDLQDMVDKALDNAMENDYEEILNWPIEDIAVDLMTFSADISDLVGTDESINENTLVPLIKNWLERRSHESQ